jgi:hypothetical protein
MLYFGTNLWHRQVIDLSGVKICAKILDFWHSGECRLPAVKIAHHPW